jgi:(E)-4-hydroxy-3-methylbut-2-enyl-diphosphate synthase
MTRQVRVGDVFIGGGSPVVVQSMTNTKTKDVTATLGQIETLKRLGCELVRVAVPDLDTIPALKEIVKESPIPVVADVHFDYRIALASIEVGCAKLRLNPGNIRDRSKIKEIAQEAESANTPIRVGANSGSLSIEGGDNKAKALVDSALEQADLLEEFGLSQIVVSVKSSDINDTIEANKLLSSKTHHPLHIGLTEAGTLERGLVRSTLALVPLLAGGIGDTIRISLTADPSHEVRSAWSILESAGRRSNSPTIISCPTCGRTHGDLLTIVSDVEKALMGITGITVAVMGCEVNGPGEAKSADIGIALGKTKVLLFADGVIASSYKTATEAIKRLVDMANRRITNGRTSIHSRSKD